MNQEITKEDLKLIADAMGKCYHTDNPFEDMSKPIVVKCRKCSTLLGCWVDYSSWDIFGEIWEWAFNKTWWEWFMAWWLFECTAEPWEVEHYGYQLIRPTVFIPALAEFMRTDKGKEVI